MTYIPKSGLLNGRVSPFKIMPLGDSITDGGAIENSGGYRKYLYALLSNVRDDIEFIGSTFDRQALCTDFGCWFMEGHSGHTLAQIAVDAAAAFSAGIIPNIILFQGGENDAGGRTLLQMQTDFQSIVAAIQAGAPNAIVVVNGCFNLVAGTVASGGTLTTRNALIDSFNSWLSTYCPTISGGKFIYRNTSSVLSGGDYLTDGEHPNAAGHAKYARGIFNILQNEVLPTTLSTRAPDEFTQRYPQSWATLPNAATTDYISITDDAFKPDGVSRYAVAIDYYPTDLTMDNVAHWIVGFGAYGYVNPFWGIQRHNGQVWAYWGGSGILNDGGYTSTTPAPLTLNEYHRILMIVDQTTGNSAMYVNGQQILFGTGATAGTWALNELRIGFQQVGMPGAPGNYSRLEVWQGNSVPAPGTFAAAQFVRYDYFRGEPLANQSVASYLLAEGTGASVAGTPNLTVGTLHGTSTWIGAGSLLRPWEFGSDVVSSARGGIAPIITGAYKHLVSNDSTSAIWEQDHGVLYSPIGGGQDDAPRILAALLSIATTCPGTPLILSAGTYTIATPIRPIPSGSIIYGNPNVIMHSTMTFSSNVTQNVFDAGKAMTPTFTTTLSSSSSKGNPNCQISTVASIPKGSIIFIQTAEAWDFVNDVNHVGFHLHLRYYTVVSNPSGAGPYTLTLDRPVRESFAVGSTVNVVPSRPTSIRLYGNGAKITGGGDTAIQFWNATDCHAEGWNIEPDAAGNAFGDYTVAFDLGCDNCTATHITCRNSGNGIGMASVERVTFAHCTSIGSPGYGIAVLDALGCTIAWCNGISGITNGIGLFIGSNGVNPSGCDDVTIIGGCYDSNSEHGIYIGGAATYAGSTNIKLLGVSARFNVITGLYIDATAVGVQFSALDLTDNACAMTVAAGALGIKGQGVEISRCTNLSSAMYLASSCEISGIYGSEMVGIGVLHNATGGLSKLSLDLVSKATTGVVLLKNAAGSLQASGRLELLTGGTDGTCVCFADVLGAITEWDGRVIGAGSVNQVLMQCSSSVVVSGDIQTNATSLYGIAAYSGSYVKIHNLSVSGGTTCTGIYSASGATVEIGNSVSSTTATPYALSGTTLVQQIGKVTAANSTAALTLAQLTADSIESSGNSSGAVTITAVNSIPGMQWTCRNNNTGTSLTSFFGIPVPTGSTSIIRINSSGVGELVDGPKTISTSGALSTALDNTKNWDIVFTIVGRRTGGSRGTGAVGDMVSLIRRVAINPSGSGFAQVGITDTGLDLISADLVGCSATITITNANNTIICTPTLGAISPATVAISWTITAEITGV
jgi:hypothetical protein